MVGKSTQKLTQFEIIEESLLEDLKDIDVKDDEDKKCAKDSKFIVNFELVPFEESCKKTYELNALCHTYFIVKEEGQEINWRKPLVQKKQITTSVKLAKFPFSEGAMRYTFYMNDLELEDGHEMVAKLPKDINPKSYNLEIMSKDIEAMVLCQHIVNEFNERIIGKQDQKLLTEFVFSYIYEFTDPDVKYKYAYAENFILGKYQKYNNNAGWRTTKDST